MGEKVAKSAFAFLLPLTEYCYYSLGPGMGRKVPTSVLIEPHQPVVPSLCQADFGACGL